MARRSSGLPDAYPALTSIGLTGLMVLLAIGTADRRAWVLTVIFGLVAVYFAYATFTWIRKIIRRR